MGSGDYLGRINGLLAQAGFPEQVSSDKLEKMQGDGSDRLFFRFSSGSSSLIVVFPASRADRDLREARASYLIGSHLYKQGVPVPAIYAYDKDHGALLLEDCGDLHLHDVLCREDRAAEGDPLYRKVIDGLILLQLEGVKGFDPAFCWDTAKYDMDLMLKRESGYFLSSFCRDYQGIISVDPGVSIEFEKLARRTARLPCDYLLHRDFQSRNILVRQGEIRIIDFQGARYGPLGYDIASLLMDPYAGLNTEWQDRLLVYYLSAIGEIIAINQDEFRHGYYLLTLQRNLQILGAFAYLSQIKGKIFFRDYIGPALHKLYSLLQDRRGKEFPLLRDLVNRLCDRV